MNPLVLSWYVNPNPLYHAPPHAVLVSLRVRGCLYAPPRRTRMFRFMTSTGLPSSPYFRGQCRRLIEARDVGIWPGALTVPRLPSDSSSPVASAGQCLSTAAACRLHAFLRTDTTYPRCTLRTSQLCGGAHADIRIFGACQCLHHKT